MDIIDSYSIKEKVLALSQFAGVGPRLFEALLARFGQVDSILTADLASLENIEGMTEQTAEKVAQARSYLIEAAEHHAKLKDRDIQIITRFDEDYPLLALELNDPPPLLFVRGAMLNNEQKSVTLVGARNATNEGIELTVKLAQEFAKANVQVVSSLCSGIDAAAHLGCKAAQAGSFAVIDTGFDNIEATEQMPLAIDIVQTGGIISEYNPNQAYDQSHQEAANRLLVGITNAVVVTEFYQNSERILDLLSFCRDIGKLVFMMVDPKHGTLSDKASLDKVTDYGVIPIIGLERTSDIIKSLV